MLKFKLYLLLIYFACVATDVWGQLQVNVTASKTAICANEEVDITVEISGGTPHYTMVFPNATKTFLTTPVTYTFSVDAKNLGSVYVRDNAGAGFVKNLSELVTVKPTPKTNFKLTDGAICPAGGDAVIKMSGSEADVQYRLKNATSGAFASTPVTGTGKAISFTVNPKPTATTQYVVEATHQTSGCVSIIDDPAVVRFFERPNKTLTVHNTAVCKGESATIMIENSEPQVRYSLQNLDGSSISGAVAVGNGGAVYLNAGNHYTAKQFQIQAAVENTTGCVEILDTKPTVTVYEPATFTTTNTTVSCFGGNNGEITVTVQTGTPPFVYKLTKVTPPIKTISSPSQPTDAPYTFSGLEAGTYQVTVLDGKGCSGK